MKTGEPSRQFWALLTMMNLLALIYPIHLLLHANSVDDNLFAICVLLISLSLLVLVDGIGIVVADAVSAGKRLHK